MTVITLSPKAIFCPKNDAYVSKYGMDFIEYQDIKLKSGLPVEKTNNIEIIKKSAFIGLSPRWPNIGT